MSVHQLSVTITADFAAGPIERYCQYTLGELGITLPIKVDASGDPNAYLCLAYENPSIRADATVLLLRASTLIAAQQADAMETMLSKLAARLRAHGNTVFAGFVPDHDGVTGSESAALIRRAHQLLEAAANVSALFTDRLIHRFDLVAPFSEAGDRLASMPFSLEYYGAMGATVAIALDSMLRLPPKMAAVDCDDTLWTGTCAEVGWEGVVLDDGRLSLQSYLLKMKASGTLLCLLSKNTLADVEAVFANRHDMLLTLDDFAVKYVSWDNKPAALLQCATQLGFDLAACSFLDDNALECELMRTSLPPVLTITVPSDPMQLPSFVDHLALANPYRRRTAEDEGRHAAYQVNALRQKVHETAESIADYRQRLQLQVYIREAGNADCDRVTQLLNRTTQFNNSGGRRYMPNEVRKLILDGSCVVAEAKDRFGTYGLVGAVIYSLSDSVLSIDTIALSCRILDRYVEHELLVWISAVAHRQGLRELLIRCVETMRNEPIRRFITSIEHSTDSFRDEDGALHVRLRRALSLEDFSWVQVARSAAVADGAELSGDSTVISRGLERLATSLTTGRRLREAVEASQFPQPPRCQDREGEDEIESAIVSAWKNSKVTSDGGMDLDYFELGGDSFQAIQMLLAIEEKTAVQIPLTVLFEDRLTIDSLISTVRRLKQ